MMAKKSLVKEIEDFERKEMRKIEEEIQYGTKELITGLLIGIIIGLGYNNIAVRDFGLMLITFAIFLGGKDKWCLDYKK